MDFRRLSTAVPKHFQALAPHRKSREKLIRTAAGSLYPNNRRRKEIINLLRQAADAEAITLAAGSPRCLVTTHDRNLRGFAEHFSRAIDRGAVRCHLQETLEEFARAAFFGLGVVKCFMGDSPAVVVEADEWLDPGYPCCLAMSQDDMVWDTQARHARAFSFVGDRYPVPFEHLAHDVRISSNLRTAIKNKGKNIFVRKDGDSSMTPDCDEDDIIDRVWLCDQFIPTEGITITYPIDGDWQPIYDEPLAEHKWDGGESGPYHYLNLGPVPDNFYPSAPGLGLLFLHQLINSNANKLEEQARDMKQVNLVQVGSEDDGAKIKNAKNGEYVPVASVGAVHQARIAGPDNNLAGFNAIAMDWFNKMGGGLDQQMGVDPGADTLGQSQMMAAAAGSVRGFYQSRFITAVGGIMKEYGRLLWADQVNRIPGSLTIPGTQISVNDTWAGAAEKPDPNNPADLTKPPPRMGEFDDYELNFIPYSTRYVPPEQRAQRISQRFAEIMGGAQIFAAAGDMPNPRRYLELMSKYEDMPEYLELISSNQQPMDLGGGSGGPADPNKGVYTHRSVSGNNANPTQDALSMMSTQGDAA